jgi:hypothetical protein
VRRPLALALAAAACAVAASPAGATNECRGLQICVPVAGPWVVASPGQVEFQLSCPKRYIVAGLDAELTTRGIDVGFVGNLGSPVNPGITTSRDAVFLGRLVRGGDAASSFRPHIGCIPASGGGSRTPTAYHAFPPGAPTARVVIQLKVKPGKTIQRVRCNRSQRLVSASHAVGFLGEAPPTSRLVHAVQASHVVRNGAAILTVKATGAVAETQAVVQLDLLCTPT